MGSLSSFDWNFENAPKSSGIHNIHPYPARFIPEIPRKILEVLYPGKDSIVLDPFCGSGTTLFEAINSGINTIGIDLNPLATLISRVKTTYFPMNFGKIGREILRLAQDRYNETNFEIPLIPNLDHWFKTDIQGALTSIVTEINSVHESNLNDALKVALSRIIVRVSNQESNTRYAAIDKDVKAQDVFEYYAKSLDTLEQSLTVLEDNLVRTLGKAKVLNRNILEVSPDEIPHNIGLVITSPPYPNVYEYWLYHKYRMFWLGLDPIKVRKSEIGARCHYFKKNHQNETDFEKQMERVFELLSKVMIPEAYAVFIVGRSIIHGREINNLEILKRASHLNGFKLDEVVERKIPSKRGSFNPRYGNMSKEHIVSLKLR